MIDFRPQLDRQLENLDGFSLRNHWPVLGSPAGKHHERCAPVRQRQRRIGAASRQQPHHFCVTAAHGEEIWRRPSHRPVERVTTPNSLGGTAFLLACIDVGVVREERTNHGHVAPCGGNVQRRISRARRVGVRAGVQKRRHHRGMPSVRSHDERAISIRRRIVHVSAGAQQ